MRDLSDPDYLAKLFNAWPSRWPPVRRLLLREGFSVDFDAREFSDSFTSRSSALSDEVVKRTSDSESDVSSASEDWELEVYRKVSRPTSPGVPKELEYTNPKWTAEAKTELKWLLNHIDKSGKSVAEIAKGIGISEKWLPKYFKENPRGIFRQTVNKIRVYRERIEGK